MYAILFKLLECHTKIAEQAHLDCYNHIELLLDETEMKLNEIEMKSKTKKYSFLKRAR